MIASAHAGGVGATPRYLDRLAASRAGLARQARADPVGLRRDRRASSPTTSRSRSSAMTPGGQADARERRLTRTAFAADRVRLHVVADRSRLASRSRRRPASFDDDGPWCWSTGRSTAWAKYENWTRGQPGRRRHRADHRTAARRAARGGRRRAHRARGRRHRRQRRRPDARHRGVAAQRRAGSQPGTDTRGLRAGLRRMARHHAHHLAGRRLRRRRHARPRRRRRAVRLARTRSCSRSKRIPPTRITRDRIDNLAAARACVSGRRSAAPHRHACPFRGR